ncbi:MAG: energy transducer TonB [Edaphobacter sp.]|uniref:energy transducer TonB n=1 Tax=Edaphobacter sp. TaxID=1934404 RepID=UPI00239816FA|nr:energy transducer TonB [Edaphobacter sp.]MDE1176324.1 energy transducer TonB [Edaphobacter sp.]
MSVIRRRSPHLLLLATLIFGTGFAHAAARRAVSKVAPIYPELARRMHVSGVVVMHLTIQPDGSVSDAKVESGHALLATAAQNAVKQWKFEPAAVTTDATVDVNFGDDH